MNLHKLLAYGSLPISIVAGITFVAHGLPKFENIAGTQGFFGSIVLPPTRSSCWSFGSNWWNISTCWCDNKNICCTLYNRYDWSHSPCKVTRWICRRYELESLLIAISVSLLITGPGRISVEWDILKREIFPRGKAIIQKQREAAQKI
jgi:putative oxidoreductase